MDDPRSSASAQWLTEVIDAMEEIIFVKGPGSQILWANRAFQEHYNLSNVDLKDLIDASHVDPKDTEKYLSADKIVFDSGERHETVEPITRHDGIALQFRTIKTGIKGPDGKVERLVGVARAIGDKTLDKEETEAFHRTHARELQQFLDALPVGVLSMDGSGAISTMNKEARKTLKITSNDKSQIRSTFEKLERVGQDGNQISLEELPINRALHRGEWVNDETIQIARKNSAKDTWLSVSSRPLTTSAKHRAVSVFADVTERVEREQILEEFAYIASHDLQEPLRIMTSYLELLDEELPDNISKNAMHYLETVTKGAAKMQKLVEGILEFSQARIGPLDAKDVALTELIRNIKTELSAQIDAIGARIVCHSDVVLNVDSSSFQNLLLNLITNAIKFHNKSQSLRINIASERTERGIRLLVSDNGIGIDKEYNDRIFKMFQRLHNDEDIPGTGIGLAYCKRIVSRHGGDIHVESKVGEGATFIVTLPPERLVNQ